MVSALLELVGFAAVVAGATMLAVPAGLIVGGVALVLVANSSRRSRVES